MPPPAVVTAIAPPARQTKSAECAPITSSRLASTPDQPPRPLDHHRPDLVLARSPRRAARPPRSRARPRPADSPGCRSRWRRSCARSRPRARPSKTCSYVVLPLYGVVRQRSIRQPLSASATWSSIEKFWHVNSGCVITTVFTPAANAPSTTANVSSRPRCAVARIRSWRAIVSSTSRVSGRSSPPSSRDLDRLDREAEPAQLVLELRPLRHLVAGLRLGAAGRLRRRVDRRHPDDARAFAGGDLDRERVHPADRPVQRDRPDRPHPGHGARRRSVLARRWRCSATSARSRRGRPRRSGGRARRRRSAARGRRARRGRAGRTPRGRAHAPGRSAPGPCRQLYWRRPEDC